MSKYLKKILITAISLVTVLSICISAVTIATANGTGDEYGTEDGGIKKGQADMVNITAVNGLQNGDFSQGLKYWGGVDGCTDPTRVASIKTEGTNKYLNFKTTEKTFNGIITVPFKVSGVKAGDYVGVRLKYRSTNSSLATSGARVDLIQNGYDRGKMVASGPDWYFFPSGNIDGEWHELVTNVTQNGGKLKPVTEPDGDADIFFMLRITGNNSILDFDIDDIEFVKFKDQTGTSYESMSYGTEEDGIILSSSNKSVSNLTAVDDFTNFDFSKGLINFGPRDTWTGFWTKLPSIGITTQNGMLKMAYTTDTNANNDYPGIRSVNVKIPDSAKGKKLFINFDAASNLDFAVRMIVDGEKQNWVWIRNYHYGTDVATPTLKNVTAKENYSGVTIGDNASEIAIEIQAQNVDTKCIYIDNIKLVYFDSNATSGPFTDLAGNKYDKDGVLIEDDEKDDEEEDPNDTYGTKDDGIKQSINPRLLPPTDKPMNLDFSKGFKYWGSSGTAFKTTDAAKLVTSGSNTYVQLTPNNSYDGGWGGIISAPFYLDVEPGATLSLLYDWKGSADYMVKLVQQNVSAAGQDIKCDGSSGTLVKTNADGWNTSWQNISNPVVEDDVKDELYSFYIYIQPKGGAEITPDTCFDNIRIIQVSGSGDNAILQDLEGNLIIFDDESSEDEYGTKADGIDISKDPRKLTPTDGPKNLDFTEGFRYWGTQETNFKASDAARLKIENGNTHIQLTPDPSYAEGWGGITTAPFYLNVKEGTTLSLLYDWKGDPNVLLKLVQVGLPEGATSKKCDAGPTTNMVVIGDTDEDWNTSWNYTFDPVLADTSDDGKYCFYIFVQPSAGADPLQDTCFDNIRIVSVDGVGDSAKLYDLNGNLLTFGNNDSGDDDEDYDEGDDYDNSYDEDEGYDNTLNNGGSYNNGSSSNSSNQVGNSGTTGNNWSGLVNADTIDVTEAMEQIGKLNSGEKVDFITLFNLDSSNGGINAYISVNTLKAKELKALKAMSEKQLKNTAVTLRAILSTIDGAPNNENAKAFAKLGGNPSNTLPLSFTGHINLDFTVNIRIKMASGSLSNSKTYYAYHCNPDTRVIDNLGKVYLEEQDDNTYITIRTNGFSDFFISPDNLKAPANADADNQNGTTNNIVLWVIIAAAAILFVVVIAIIIIILNKRKRLVK